MIDHSKCWVAVLFVAFFSSGVAWADEVQAPSKVTAATVYADRANVTRSGTVKLPVGADVIIIGSMPAGFDESSLRVQGKAQDSVKIGSVEVKRVFLAELAAAAEQEKAKALQAKRDEKAMVEAEIQALRTRETFIERLANGDGGPKPEPANGAADAAVKSLPLAPEKWAQAWDALQAGMSETQKGIVTRQIAERQIDEQIAKLENDYQQVQTARRERIDVYIHVEAAQATEFQFDLSYQMPGVSWQPVYDARLDTDKGEMQLEQYGLVAQSTGEDWADVALTLSTSHPELGTEMPYLSPWVIQNFRPQPVYAARMEGAVAMKAMNSAADAVSESDQRAPGAPPMQQAVQQMAQLQASDYAAEFRVPGKVDLKSVAAPTKYYIGGWTMKADLALKTTPKLVAQAYLFAKITNAEKNPFVAGAVAKYRDGAFIGNAAMKMLRPGETLELSFGVDDRVKVSYLKTKEEQSNPALVYVGDATMMRAYRAKVKNLHKQSMTIAVYDQFPIAGNPDLKVRLLDDATTAGYVKDNEDRQGVLLWSGAYTPDEEKIFDVAFEVKYPHDQPPPVF